MITHTAVTRRTVPERGEAATAAAVNNAGKSSGSRPGEDNSVHVFVAILVLAAVAVGTGHLNVKLGK